MADKKVNLIISLKDGVSGKLAGIKGKLSSLVSGFKVVAVAGLAFGGVLVGLAKQAADFNVQMARVWTMAGGGVKNFKALRAEAKALAVEFGLAGKEIATGMYNALSAGIKQSELSTFMKTAAKVAVADGSEIATAVDGITTVLNAFKIEASKSDEVADALFKTVALGKTTFGELSKSLATVAPIAAASNIPLKQILAHVASLTAQGVPTAQAMTQIRASIIGLNKALGDGWSDTMSYQDALKAVWKQAGESQSKLLELVGSTEAMSAVLGGVGKNAEIAAEKLDGMTDSADAAQEAFDKVDQFRDWEKLLSAAKSVMDAIGVSANESLAPTIRDITAALAKWGEAGGEVSFQMSELAFTLEALKPTLQFIGDIFSGMAAGVRYIGGAIGGAAGAIGANGLGTTGTDIVKGAASGAYNSNKDYVQSKIDFKKAAQDEASARRIEFEKEKTLKLALAKETAAKELDAKKAGSKTVAELEAELAKLNAEEAKELGLSSAEEVAAVTKEAAIDAGESYVDSISDAFDESNPIAEAIQKSNEGFGITHDTPTQDVSGGGGGINSLTGVNDIFGSLTTRGIEGGGGLTTTKALEAIKDLLGTNPEDMSEAMKTALADVYSEAWKTTDLTLYEKISKHVSTITTMFSTAFGNATKAVSDCALKEILAQGITCNIAGLGTEANAGDLNLSGAQTGENIDGIGFAGVTDRLDKIYEFLGASPEKITEVMKTALTDVYSESWNVSDANLAEILTEQKELLGEMYALQSERLGGVLN